MTTSLKTTLNEQFSIQRSTTEYAVYMCFIMTACSLIKNFARFSAFFILGNCLVLVIIATVIVHSVSQLADSGVAETAQPIKLHGILPMAGVSILTYEGIGVVMPIM